MRWKDNEFGYSNILFTGYAGSRAATHIAAPLFRQLAHYLRAFCALECDNAYADFGYAAREYPENENLAPFSLNRNKIRCLCCNLRSFGPTAIVFFSLLIYSVRINKFGAKFVASGIRQLSQKRTANRQGQRVPQAEAAAAAAAARIYLAI